MAGLGLLMQRAQALGEAHHADELLEVIVPALDREDAHLGVPLDLGHVLLAGALPVPVLEVLGDLDHRLPLGDVREDEVVGLGDRGDDAGRGLGGVVHAPGVVAAVGATEIAEDRGLEHHRTGEQGGLGGVEHGVDRHIFGHFA
ncbi:MAG: hypothetical protein J5374_03125, partial [Bacteroidales bacterium]|nr:hypothetical protein [Bacteroidales bacterium]